MLEIYLARHGQNEDNAAQILNGHRDLPLTEIGRQQATEVAQLAKDNHLKFDHVYVSPLIRARQTAEIIASATGSPTPIIMPELIERDLGNLTGHPSSDILKVSKNVIQTEKVNYFLDIGESFPATLKRAAKVLDKVRAAHADGKVLLVTHGDIGKMIFASFHGEPWREVLKHFHFGNCELLLLREDYRHAPHVFRIDQRGVKDKA
ncbi:MAG TPA: histidine phosphatase family protein [Candidatus Saccharimonadales bacterium]|nr:histidine phosphatase family protein [Candidatus Saccharimonadales bacterium]